MKINKKTVSQCTAIALVGATLVSYGVSSQNNFTDVPSNHWAYSSIQKAASNNWVSGIGSNRYDPEGKVTEAEWYTMVIRSIYPDKIPAKAKTDEWYSGEWFSPYVEAGTNLGFNYGEVSVNKKAFERPITRTRMAHIVSQVVGNHGLTLPEEEMQAIAAKIPDLDPMDLNWYSIVNAYSTGVLTGVDNKGTFDGDGVMDRAQAATVLCRLNDWIAKNGERLRDEIEIQKEELAKQEAANAAKPETSAPPSAQPSTGNSSGAVGTLSDSRVTLSYATHKPVVDYWSQTSSAVQARTDKDMYNALVQTLKDREMIGENREKIENGYRNPYYNYAVYTSVGFKPEDSERRSKQKLLGRTFVDIPLVESESVKTRAAIEGDSFWDVKTHPEEFNNYNFYEPYFNKFTTSMSDKEKAEICVKAVIDKFEYDADIETGGWEDENPKMACGGFATEVSLILSAAGIPNIQNTGNNHAWNYALLDGQWYAIDASKADLYGDKYWIANVEEYDKKTLAGREDRALNYAGSAANIAKTAFEQAYLN